jgi:hypothetical protein
MYPEISLVLPGRWVCKPLDSAIQADVLALVEQIAPDAVSREAVTQTFRRVLGSNPDHVWIQILADELTVILLSWPSSAAGEIEVGDTARSVVRVALADFHAVSPDGLKTAQFDVVSLSLHGGAIDRGLFADIIEHVQWL